MIPLIVKDVLRRPKQMKVVAQHLLASNTGVDFSVGLHAIRGQRCLLCCCLPPLFYQQ